MADQLGNPGISSPEQQPARQAAEPTADFTRQVEMYKTNLQQKFGQKALETGVSVMALAANIPGLKDASSFIRGARAVLGTATASMLGGDLGKQLGLSKFSAEQGQRVQEFLEKTKQFFNEDGSARALSGDERLAAEELRTEMTKQLELSAAVAKTTEHHKLFGRMIEEDLDKSAQKSEGWGKESLKGIASGIRGLFSRETLNKAGRLALKVGNTKVSTIGNGAWQLAKAGGRNWKTLAWMGAPMAAVWLAPVAAPFVMTGTIGLGVAKKAGQMRELYRAHGQAEERVQAYQQFSVAHIPTVRGLAEQMIKLDKAMGKADTPQDLEAMMANLQTNISQETYQHVAQAVRQAAAQGAGAGFAVGAFMYGVMGHHDNAKADTDVHEATRNAQEAVSTQPKLEYGGPPTASPPVLDPRPDFAPNDHNDTFIHQRDGVAYGKPAEFSKDTTAPGPSDTATGNTTAPKPDGVPAPRSVGDVAAPKPPEVSAPGAKDVPAPIPHDVTSPIDKGNVRAPGAFSKDVPAPQPHNPETIAVGRHMHVDVNGDGRTDTPGLKEDYLVETDKATGRACIKMPYMDTNGDGKFDTLRLSKEDIAKGIKEKYVKVFVDHATRDSGYLGHEIHIMANGKENIQGTLWVGDKDEWMRSQVGADKWNQVRDHVKGSVGPDGHETKGWGFIARRGPMVSLETHTPTDVSGLSGKALETAIKDTVPEIQLDPSTYNPTTNTSAGNWLGAFLAEFTNATKIPQAEINLLTEGWPTDIKLAFGQTPFAFDGSSFHFQHFEVPADKFTSFAKALIYNHTGLPSELKRALQAIHEQKSSASDSLLEALKTLKKKQFTIEDLIRAAKIAKASPKVGQL